MDYLINIECQYYENYNLNPDGEPRWKPKGGRTFQVNMDVDYLMCAYDKTIEVFKKIVEEQSDCGSRYEYVSHEPVFFKHIHLDLDVNSMVDKTITE